MVAQAYVRKIGGIDVPSGMTDEEFIAAYRERKAFGRSMAARTDQAFGSYEHGYGHDPECDCSVCQTNDRLGYDADVSDPSQYCKHGTFIGSSWGPDYLCSACESGYEPAIAWMERRARRTRHMKSHGKDRIGTKTVRELVAHMIRLAEHQNETTARWATITEDDPAWKKEGLLVDRDIARRAEIDYRLAYFGLMTEKQQEWVMAIFRANSHKESRAAIAELTEKIEAWGLAEGWDRQLIDDHIERLTQRHKAKTTRIDPLAYHTPRSNVSEAMERQEALQVWFRGIYAEMDRDCLVWLDVMIAEWKKGTNEHIGWPEFLRAIVAEKYGDEVREGYPVDDSATDHEIAKAVGAHFWWRVDAWRRTEAGRSATGA